ncbi:ZIP family metal transporter [Namhaeicola litoreus]|uniref:ZIP family metal transporter n=1 Tax=Namhaeicola litoreus TaxID=1052145 RepID=A0ABW3Y438_9FLAO
MSYWFLLLAVALGAVIAFYLNPGKKVLQLLLSFSGAYLLSMTVLHLIPEVYNDHSQNIGVFILIGIIIQTILEFFSKGAEHGHVHIHTNTTKIPWILFISLYIHAFLEGMPLGIQNNSELLWAIIIHKIPVAVILVIFLIKSGLKKSYILGLVLIFAFASPIGSFFGEKIRFLHNYHEEISAVIIGIFLHISTAILFESSESHKFNLQKFIAIITGFSVALIGAL